MREKLKWVFGYFIVIDWKFFCIEFINIFLNELIFNKRNLCKNIKEKINC